MHGCAQAIDALPHDAHFMGIVLTAINALSTCHPEQNPALAGQSVYNSKEIQDKQIVRLIGRLLQSPLDDTSSRMTIQAAG